MAIVVINYSGQSGWLKRPDALYFLLAGQQADARDTASYTYDALGRLTAANHASGQASYIAAYAYDSAGNRSLVTVSKPAQPAPVIRGWQDFDGDGHGDLLWRDANGTIQTWRISGSNGDQVQQNAYSNSSVGNDWQIVGPMDMNGNGKTDVLWRHWQGGLSAWVSNGSGFQDHWANFDVGTDWQIVGLADYTGDSKTDILWRHSTGSLSIWASHGTGYTQSFWNGNLDNGWQVKGSGDFNGDGKADVLWRHSNGNVAVWPSTGSGLSIASVGSTYVPINWKIVGFPDWNADGYDDIFWRNDDGSIHIYSSTGSGWAGSYSGHADPNWVIQVITDFNHDNKADIAFRHSNGQLAAWNSTGLTYNGTFGMSVSTSWNLIRKPSQLRSLEWVFRSGLSEKTNGEVCPATL